MPRNRKKKESFNLESGFPNRPLVRLWGAGQPRQPDQSALALFDSRMEESVLTRCGPECAKTLPTNYVRFLGVGVVGIRKSRCPDWVDCAVLGSVLTARRNVGNATHCGANVATYCGPNSAAE